MNNIWHGPYSPKKNKEVLLFRGDARAEGLASDYNLFYSPLAHQRRVGVLAGSDRQPVAIGEDLAAWQAKTGQDRHSLWADALFADAAKGDFRLKPGSPAIGAGAGSVTIGAAGILK
jgi:hypothetical protein